jgi:hypothetical protein
MIDRTYMCLSKRLDSGKEYFHICPPGSSLCSVLLQLRISLSKSRMAEIQSVSNYLFNSTTFCIFTLSRSTYFFFNCHYAPTDRFLFSAHFSLVIFCFVLISCWNSFPVTKRRSKQSTFRLFLWSYNSSFSYIVSMIDHFHWTTPMFMDTCLASAGALQWCWSFRLFSITAFSGCRVIIIRSPGVLKCSRIL